VLEMARDLLAELDSRNPHIWHVFSCRVGFKSCECAGRWPEGSSEEVGVSDSTSSSASAGPAATG